MRVVSVMMIITCCADPFEVVLRGVAKLMFAAVVKILQRCVVAFIVDQPFEDLDFGNRFADLEHHEQVRPANRKL